MGYKKGYKFFLQFGGIKIQAIKERRTVFEILNELIKEYLREKGAV